MLNILVYLGGDEMYDYMSAYSNFELSDYSQEELELFGSSCGSQLLASVAMIRFASKDANTFKPFGFTKNELGNLCELASRMVRGVNLNGGYDNYCDLLHDFLVSVGELNTTKTENSAKNDLKFAIAKQMRDRTNRKKRGSSFGYIL